MQLMPHCRNGGFSRRSSSDDEPRCPPTPVIRPVPLLQQPPTLRLTECPISSSAHFESRSPKHPGQTASSKQVYQFAADDGQPTWVVDLMKKAGNASKGMKGAPIFCPKNKHQTFSNSIWKFLSNSRKTKARDVYRKN